jgi:putative ABC transport system substrate-binding protein
MPVIGYLSAAAAGGDEPLITALRQGLKDGGYVDGQNVEVLFRYAENQFDRLPSLASDLVHRRVAVIVAAGSAPALAAKGATTAIPIVFEAVYDPVAIGLVASLGRPGGNITGASVLAEAYYAKGVELLHELLPQARSIALLANPTNPTADTGIRETEKAARSLGLSLRILHASNPGEIEQAFTMFAQDRSGGILVTADRLFSSQRDQLAALTVRYRVPCIYMGREWVQAGGLISYGANRSEAFRIVGNYAARILKGEQPADLPVQLATRIELTINRKTAKALGIEVPTSILLRADEVIE